jgi:hypothetical protein
MKKFGPKMGAVANKTHDLEVAQAEAPHLARVDWKSDPGLRKLYLWAVIICMASATTGYDGYARFTSS